MKKPSSSSSNLIYLQQHYQDGVKYLGMSLNGLKHGYGKLLYNDGAYYQGNFYNDKIHGHGVLYYNVNKPAYDGQWYQEQFHGYGKLYNQEPQILGLQQWEQNNNNNLNHNHNNPHKKQSFPYHNFNLLQNYWIKYQGQFKNDNKHGYGRLELTSNEYYEGSFCQDMIDGIGKFIKNNGQVIQGKWDSNILVQVIEDDQGEQEEREQGEEQGEYERNCQQQQYGEQINL